MTPIPPGAVEELARHRRSLRLLAALLLPARLARKVDPSDVVQQTMLQAQEAWADFRGRTDAERAAWLRQILRRVVLHLVREYAARKRDVARERSLERVMEESSVRLERWLAADRLRPEEHAMRAERLELLATAMECLDEPQREALLQHYWHGLSVSEIATLMNRSTASVAGLLRRALERLRENLPWNPLATP